MDIRQTNQPPQPIYRKDYQQPDYWIDDVALTFELGENATQVHSILQVRPNPDLTNTDKPLVLHGDHLTLKHLEINNTPLTPEAYRIEPEQLIILQVPNQQFELRISVEIKPQENTALEGLYQTSGNFCTQCEAEGFRRITYFLDRPDVMASYRTKIIADKTRYPVLLSNGNRIANGEYEDGRHWVEWQDPFRKPSYLFALVAGQLSCHSGTYTTRSGREVRLEIWVEPQNIDKCAHALQSLQKAMRWDEETFGLEYDLDIYMIVAVNDFNMGAMENKGLNVFNSKFVLCRPDTATDDDYEDIEAVIAHEYFHNWTGNRVTCRDWFQLTLKEGLTVYRDQRFTSDMTAATVKRIKDVKKLRMAQFAEDQGPMAHPIRPESYIEMNNFYTITVYEKGAEVIRLYEILLGKEGFRRGMDLYFQRHDGQAVTCDDFRAAMADANTIDLSQFERWYTQAGTPIVEVRGLYDETAHTYSLQLSQSRAELPTPHPLFEPLMIPFRIGLLDSSSGEDLPLQLQGETAPGASTRILPLNKLQQTFTFINVPSAPVPSLARDFSAPVQVNMHRPREQLAFLMAHDSDGFNRWDAGQTLAQTLLLELAKDWAAGRELKIDPLFINSFGQLLTDNDLNASLKALAILLPEEKLLGQYMQPVDVDALHEAHAYMMRLLAHTFRRELMSLYQANNTDTPYSNDRAAIDRRQLKNNLLRYLVVLQDEEVTTLLTQQLKQADNMTDAQGALKGLVEIEGPAREAALQQFYEQWQHDPLVLDKWFMIQAQSSLPKTLDRVLTLAEHPDFTLRNPNRARALVWSFCANNQVRFHSADGRGYKFLGETVLELDPLNPQLASRMVSAFNQWRRFDKLRRNLMESQLNVIASQPNLSPDVYEIVSKSLSSQ